MLIDQLKQQMFSAMKANRKAEKEILRTAIGEVTRTGDDPTDERVLATLKKLFKSNEETLKLATDAAQIEELKLELEVLRGFLPSTPNAEQLLELLAPVADTIRAAGGDGPAMGAAMKFLKAQAIAAEAPDVAQAVKRLRS
jgi:uncharacterized protein